MTTRKIINLNSVTALRYELASAIVSPFQLKAEELSISSKQSSVGTCNLYSDSKASCLSAQPVLHKSLRLALFNELPVVSCCSSTNFLPKASCFFGELLKNHATQLPTFIIFLTSVMLVASTIQRFSMYEAQCLYKAFGYLLIIHAAKPLLFPAMEPALSYPCPQNISISSFQSFSSFLSISSANASPVIPKVYSKILKILLAQQYFDPQI